MKKSVMSVFQVLVLTLIYVIAVSLVSGVLISTGFEFPEMEMDQSRSFMQLIFAGLISSLLVVFLARKYHKLKSRTFFFIIFFILFLSNFSVSIEGNIFTPGLITNSVLLTLGIQQFSIALLFAFFASLLNRKKLFSSKETDDRNDSHKLSFVFKLVLGSIVYMAMYYIWGRINYSLFTKPYYELGISGLDVPSTGILIKYIFIRGILITLSIVPFIKYALPENRFKMYETGLILFLFGGLIPLTLTLGIFPMELVLYSLVEIFLQNFITGIIIYKIVRSKFRFSNTHS
ncbi:MAG: hypothetical protein K9H49_17945 [Bacteroidales bacterium]|nr:hypothetical protein [Bacteroidales bacterium]MCF8391374.1 hypothetical protein [Bacteroidales bacterium]